MALSHVGRDAQANVTREVPPFEDIHESQFGIVPNLAPHDVQEEAPARRRFEQLRSLFGPQLPTVRRPRPHTAHLRGTVMGPRATEPATGHLRGTARELRERRGHSVPPPPRTWAEESLPDAVGADWSADGMGASAPPLIPDDDVDQPPSEHDSISAWTAERLDLLDRTVTKDHADNIHHLQLEVQILQNHLYTFIGAADDGDSKDSDKQRKVKRYAMSNLVTSCHLAHSSAPRRRSQ